MQTYQLLIPPSIESKLVCGLNTLIPFADNFKRDAWRVLDSFRDLVVCGGLVLGVGRKRLMMDCEARVGVGIGIGVEWGMGERESWW